MSNPELTKVYVRYREGLPENEMFYYARQGFWTLGVETAPFTRIDDIATMTDLGPTVGISGYIGDVQAALRKLGTPLPDVLDYPLVLTSFLGRQIWRSTLGTVRNGTASVFVKSQEQKAFTGFVWQADRASRMRVVTHGDDTQVWCSEVVDFVSEYRAFVLDGEVLDCRLYRGDWASSPDRGTVERAVKAMGREAPRAYALDWGVTRDGRTLLVEVNDAFSLGHYGLAPVSYARMISARWHEMVNGKVETR